MILELTPNTHPILHNKVKPCSVNLDRHFVAKTLVENMIPGSSSLDKNEFNGVLLVTSSTKTSKGSK